MSVFKDIRVLPVVLAGIAGLAVLKISGLAFDGHYVFSGEAPAKRLSWAQENLNYPSSKPAIDVSDITGSVEAKPKAVDAKEVAAVETTTAAEPKRNDIVLAAQDPSVSPAERAVLERLQERRRELEARAREIDIRESLLKAAEKRVELRVEELKGIEGRLNAHTEQKKEAEAARFKGIVTMYEAMKPKDAAKIFDRLEMSVLIEVASQIAPRKMSDILGLMQTEAAERLTVELARRAGADKSASIANLPKIEGRPQPSARP